MIRPRDLAAFLADVARAVWERATDATRRDVCADCRCPHRERR